MFVAQGLSDELVKPATTEAYAAQLCAAGEHLDFRTYEDIGHGTVAERAVIDVLPFFADALAGRTTKTTC